MIRRLAVLLCAIGRFALTDLPNRIGWGDDSAAVDPHAGDDRGEPDDHQGHDHGSPSESESIEVSQQARANLRLKTEPIEAEKLVLNLKNEGEVKTFDLTAKREASDPEGLSSQFVSADPMLHQWLDSGAEGKLTIEIEGKSYNGNVAYDHDHSGHDH